MTPPDKSTVVRGYFDTIAARYDLTNTLLSFGLHYLWKKRAVRAAEILPESRVLDLCGGTADLAIRAARAGAASVTVLDFSPEMLRVGRGKAAGFSNISFICGDAQNMDLPDAAFDVVLIGFGLRNLSDRQRGLREMLRVLKPGGRLVCLEFSSPVWPWFRALYGFYSRYIIPAAGQLIAESREAYEYLPDSIQKFPLPGALADEMLAAGFTRAGFALLTNGIAAIHRAEKAAQA